MFNLGGFEWSQMWPKHTGVIVEGRYLTVIGS
jgi:hypothetical protein